MRTLIRLAVLHHEGRAGHRVERVAEPRQDGQDEDNYGVQREQQACLGDQAEQRGEEEARVTWA
jgi:hypothetical protein